MDVKRMREKKEPRTVFSSEALDVIAVHQAAVDWSILAIKLSGYSGP